MTLSPAFLDELRARTSLSGLIAPSVKLIKAGREFKACCPFHQEKTPSFTVNDDKGFYHCFGCGAHGDAIRFLTDARGMQFMDAVKELAAKAGMEVPAADPRSRDQAERASGLTEVMGAVQAWFAEQLHGADGAEARHYLASRGIDGLTIARFGLGLAPQGRNRLKQALSALGEDKLIDTGMLIKPDDGGDSYDRFRGRLMFPIRDQRGRVIAFGGRVLGDGEPKYLNSPDTPLFDKGRTLYNVDRAGPASRAAKRLIVVEGYMDVIALDRAGIAETVAPNGTAVTENQLERLWKLDPAPILCFDGDSAGRKAAVRAALRALPHIGPERTLRFVELPAGQDPDDVVRSDGKEGIEELILKARPLSEFVFGSELEREPLNSPESRAGLGKRLRDLAKIIEDDDVRTQYLGLFNGLLEEMFSSLKSGGGFETSKAAFKHRRLSPEMLAIAKLGMTQAVEVRVILLGLRNFPELIAELAEPLASVWIKRRDWSQIREAMLRVALEKWPLDSETLDRTLREEALDPHLKRMQRPYELRYSFLHSASGRTAGRSDLIGVLERVTSGAHFENEIKRAQVRYNSASEEERLEAYDDLQRLVELKSANEQKFTEYRQEHGETEEHV